MDNRHFSIDVDIAARPDRVWQSHERCRTLARMDRVGHQYQAPGQGTIRGRHSRAIIKQPKFPPALWKVTAIEPHRFTWKSGMPGLWVFGRHSVDPNAGGSRATLSVEYTGILGPLMGRLTRGITERYLKLEAEGLKKRSETA